MDIDAVSVFRGVSLHAASVRAHVGFRASITCFSASVGAAELLFRKAGSICSRSTGHENCFSHSFSQTFNSLQLFFLVLNNLLGLE